MNSRSEYSRCWVPRLQLNMTGWTRGKKKESADKEVAEKKDPTSEEAEDQALLEELLRIKQDTRRLDGKRKGDGQGRAKKRRKFDRLVGWGEAVEVPPLNIQNVSSHREVEPEVSTQQGDMTNWRTGLTECKARSQAKERVVTDTEKMLKDAKKAVEESTLEMKRFEKK